MGESKPGTLGFHRDMSAFVFGEQSPATTYLDELIAKSANGRDEEVVVDEGQVIALLFSIHERGKEQ